MPWSTPTLRSVRELVRNEVVAALPGAVLLGNSVLRVLSDVTAATAHLTMRYVDWVSQQLLPDTAETIFLDRHADIWLVNSDNTVGRKSAVYATGTINVVGDVAGGVIPEASLLSAVGLDFETTAQVAVGQGQNVAVPVRALTAGVVGNLEIGTAMSFNPLIAGIVSNATVLELQGGTDTEDDTDLRARVLQRIRNPPMGGDASDYVLWAESVPGVTRAWSSNELGPGIVTVRFVMDDQRVDGIPGPDDIARVKAYLDTVRPVAIKDLTVQPPVPEPVNFSINNLVPNTTDTWTAIVQSVTDMLRAKAHPAYLSNGQLVPAQTIYAAWVSEAVMQATGVVSFDLDMDDHVMPSNGSLAVLGTVTHGADFDPADFDPADLAV